MYTCWFNHRCLPLFPRDYRRTCPEEFVKTIFYRWYHWVDRKAMDMHLHFFPLDPLRLQVSSMTLRLKFAFSDNFTEASRTWTLSVHKYLTTLWAIEDTSPFHRGGTRSIQRIEYLPSNDRSSGWVEKWVAKVPVHGCSQKLAVGRRIDVVCWLVPCLPPIIC
jgi:hypothetical protein